MLAQFAIVCFAIGIYFYLVGVAFCYCYLTYEERERYNPKTTRLFKVTTSILWWLAAPIAIVGYVVRLYQESKRAREYLAGTDLIPDDESYIHH